MYEYKAKVINVVDGDTFDLECDLGFYIKINIRLRLLDCDTPENRGEESNYGRIVSVYLNNLLLDKNVIIRSKKGGTTTDSFGRWLCSIEYDGIDLATHLTELGVNKFAANFSYDNVNKLKAFDLKEKFN